MAQGCSNISRNMACENVVRWPGRSPATPFAAGTRIGIDVRRHVAEFSYCVQLYIIQSLLWSNYRFISSFTEILILIQNGRTDAQGFVFRHGSMPSLSRGFGRGAIPCWRAGCCAGCQAPGGLMRKALYSGMVLCLLFPAV